MRDVPALFDRGLGVGVRGGGLPGEHLTGGEAGAGIWLRSMMLQLLLKQVCRGALAAMMMWHGELGRAALSASYFSIQI